MTAPALIVSVLDYKKRALPEANIKLEPVAGVAPSSRSVVHFAYDKLSQFHQCSKFIPGEYVLTVSVKGLDPQSRSVQIDATGLRETFLLGKKGMPFLYRGKVKVPFEPSDDLLGVAFRGGKKVDAARGLRAALEGSKWTLVPLAPAVAQDNLFVVRLPNGSQAADRAQWLQKLAGLPGFQAAGPVVHLDDESVVFFSDEAVIRFASRLSEAEAREAAARFDFDLVRPFLVAPNTFLAKPRKGAGYEMLAQCASLVESGLVEYAEPNLISTPGEDGVIPTDNLFPLQWHHAIVRTPDAWQVLRLQVGDDRTFGDPHIIIAVMDYGIDVRHPDLDGRDSGGRDKIFRIFDFENLVPNNDLSVGRWHGTSCAGIAAARANNPSEEVRRRSEGVVGAAGNCRIMGLRRPFTDVGFADAFVWAAGFLSSSPDPDFARPLPQGAEIITTQVHHGDGFPISGLMADTFDFLTTSGREGRGTLLFFSAGNGHEDFTDARPWATHARTIAVGASSLGNDGFSEIIADYSNYGGPIPGGAILDVVAPSSDTNVDGQALHNPPVNYGITTTAEVGAGNLPGAGGRMNYTNRFGGTSASTPLVAGIAALVLSANPDLTWMEVRDILRNTATKINRTNTDSLAQYVDTDEDGMPDYSRVYGFGRVNAYAAVLGALPPALARKPRIFEGPKIFPEKPLKDRIEEVKGNAFDNPFAGFEHIFDPQWAARLEERLKKIETQLEQSTKQPFIRKEERPPVGEEIARKAKTRKH